MQPTSFSQSAYSGLSPCRLLLSVGLPLLLLLAFLGRQWLNFDDIGWSNGFNHPLTGWDHLITMLAVGVWAAQLRGQAIWMLPLAFVGVMSLGGLAGAAGLAIPSVEGIILLSCAVFSVLITRKVRFSTHINVLIVAFFGFFHGFAHGQEISTSASLISYTLGFMLATLLLHGAGILVAKLVVFAVTCLLTVIFSSAALAKTAETIIDHNSEDKNTVLLQVVGVSKIMAFADDNSRLCDVGGGEYSITGKVANVSFGSFFAGKCHLSYSHVLILKSAVWPVAPDKLLTPKFFNWAQPGNSQLDFKHYYPDINHTPGKQLLSNGVGLTSPPSPFLVVLAPQNFLESSKSLVLATEESDLLVFAVSDTSNSNTQVRRQVSHNDTLRCLSFIWPCAGKAVYRNHSDLFRLTPNRLAYSDHLISDVRDFQITLAVSHVSKKAGSGFYHPKTIINNNERFLPSKNALDIQFSGLSRGNEYRNDVFSKALSLAPTGL